MWKYKKYIIIDLLLFIIASIIEDSMIMCFEGNYDDTDVEAKSNDQANFNEKKATCKTQKFYILLAFLVITIALLTAISIYCYLIKYRAK